MPGLTGWAWPALLVAGGLFAAWAALAGVPVSIALLAAAAALMLMRWSDR